MTTTAEHKFACILATIHSTYNMGDVDLTLNLIKALPKAITDDLAPIYYSEEVDEFLGGAFEVLYPEAADAPDEEETVTVDGDSTLEELLAAADQFLAALAEDDGQTTCGDPDCACAEYEEDNEELLAETDEFVIVKIWK